ncbi:MAG: hypothetical protein ACRD4C_15660 [Candidatus Acidiferrales bacterium]
MFDFAIFLIEAGLLFAAGWSLSSGITTFVSLGLLLFIDITWGLISHQIHFPGKKSHARKWSAINIVAIFIAALTVAFDFRPETIILMSIAIVRTILDYRLCWNFYFPYVETEYPTASVAPVQ